MDVWDWRVGGHLFWETGIGRARVKMIPFLVDVTWIKWVKLGELEASGQDRWGEELQDWTSPPHLLQEPDKPNPSVWGAEFALTIKSPQRRFDQHHIVTVRPALRVFVLSVAMSHGWGYGPTNGEVLTAWNLYQRSQCNRFALVTMWCCIMTWDK